MKIIFDIKKLGAITNSTIEFKPFMIFSGDSSLGKSYSAFLSYYFISLFTKNRLKTFIDQKYLSNEISTNFIKDGKVTSDINIKDLQSWINFNSSQFIGYLIGYPDFNADVDIKFEMSDIKIDFILEKSIDSGDKSLTPQEFIKINIGDETFTANGSYKINIPELILAVLNVYFKKNLFDKGGSYHTMFFPPSRAALVGTNFSTTQEIMSSAGMYKEFLKDMEIINSATEQVYNPSENITRIIEDLIGGKIKNEKGSLFFEFEEQKIPITSAASSIKELAPLFLLLKRFSPQDFSVLFEEPEAHTHPNMQIKLANVICQLVNEGAFFQITTHSDYFLNQVNNLTRLFRIKKNNPSEFDIFCKKHGFNKHHVLDPNSLGAYYFKRREDNSVEIIMQNTENGIPFDTFEKTVDKLMTASSIIEDHLETMNYNA